MTSASGAFLANAAKASRKDVRDAVRAARSAFHGWSGTSPYQRGQVLYRIAETLQARRIQLVADVAAAEGLDLEGASAVVDAAIDRWIWYTGWTDKLVGVQGSVNSVAGPYACYTVPEPCGVVGVVAPQDSALLGLVSVVAPVLATGNTAIVLASESRPLAAVTFAEALAASGLPSGVVNLLTGSVAELAPWLASHLDVNAIDLAGVTDPILTADLEAEASINLKRVVPASDLPEDWSAVPGIGRLTAFTDTKTIWHPAEA